MIEINRASAGSGKTFALARDYIRLLVGIKDGASGPVRLNLAKTEPPRLLRDYPHRSILAITFTRKATAEMMTRILNELDILADPAAKSHYAPGMMQELGCSRQDLATTAGLALRQILFDYHNFSVSTIDAFFQRVLHTFARELDMQSDYALELNDKAAMRSALAEMLDEFNTASPSSPLSTSLERWLIDHMEQQISEGRKANFFNRDSYLHTSLADELATISSEDFKPHSDAMYAYLQSGALSDYAKALAKRKTLIMGEIKSRAQQALEGVVTADLAGPVNNLLTNNCQPKPNIPEILERFATSTISKVCNGDQNAIFKSRKGTPEQKERISQFILWLMQEVEQILTIQTIQKSLNQLNLLRHAWDYVKNSVEKNNTLLISDTNSLVKRIIGADDTPFIYERMGVRYGSFLIDEFQDTSRMQWDNLAPLVANGLAEGHDSLVIGDEKQSIYRFRNSDSTILHTEVEEKMRSYLAPNASRPQRSTNFRSSAPVVRFNNSLFTLLAQATGVPGFENVVQNISDDHLHQSGYVRINPVEKKAKDDPDADPDAVFTALGQEILRQLAAGYRGRDIAVLCNTNREAANIVNFLLTRFPQITILSDDALLVASSAAVQIIVSVMRMIQSSQASPAAEPTVVGGGAAHSPAVAINRLEYYIATHPELDPQEAIELALSPEAQLPQIPAFDNATSLSALVESIIAQHVAPADRKSQFSFIAAFQDLVLKFSESTLDPTLNSFLAWWDAHKEKATIAGADYDDAVRVMTVHKSKGLEFACVLIPLCDWTLFWRGNLHPKLWLPVPDIPGEEVPKPPLAHIALDKNAERPSSPFRKAYADERAKALSDTMNKTYVAFTRARRELIIWTKGAANTIGALINDAIAKGLPESDPLLQDGLGENLRAGLDPATGIFSLGEPTVPSEPSELSEPSPAADPTAAEPTAAVPAAEPTVVGGFAVHTTIGATEEPYPVHFRADIQSILTVESALTTDPD